jgi:DNA polymerase (family 10)
MLLEMAALLEAQGDNVFRVSAYRNAAHMIATQPRSLRELFQREGLAGLDALPTIGPGIAAAIAEIVQTGRWARLDRLRGTAGVEAVFHTIPGVGMALAHRLHDELEVDSLESLETAARDGRLERLPQIGPRRAAAIRASLTQMLDRARAFRRARPAPATDDGAGSPADAVAEAMPPVELLLEVDRTYRSGAEAGTLPTIAPHRFNPEGKSWLPVLHTRHGDWHFTALFSNTARAHELGRVRDWVVIYAEDREHREHQCTVVTAPAGPLAGRRVVRGREAECRAWYAGR